MFNNTPSSDKTAHDTERHIVRISVTGFARIRDDQGRYAVLVNKGRLTRGKGRILSPIGGGLEYTPQGRRYLESLGATDFEGDRMSPVVPDLRFRVPNDQVLTVVDWFERRRNRETSVRREMTEELTHETRVLTLGSLRSATEEFVGFFRYNATTTRDVPEKETVYLIEAFNVMLNERAMRTMKAASQIDIMRRWVYFVTRTEIEAGITRDGIEIGPITRYIL